MFFVYHGRTTATGDQGVVFIDRMKILKDGRLVVEGPTTAPQGPAIGCEEKHVIYYCIYPTGIELIESILFVIQL